MNKDQVQELISYCKEQENDFTNIQETLSYELETEQDKLLNINNVQELEEFLIELNDDRRFTNVEVIYYANAIEILQREDPSLQECLNIAYELGYQTKDLNSEILASLLLSQTAEEEYNTFVTRLCDYAEDFFNQEEE